MEDESFLRRRIEYLENQVRDLQELSSRRGLTEREKVIKKAEDSFAAGMHGYGYSCDEGELLKEHIQRALTRAGLDDF